MRQGGAGKPLERRIVIDIAVDDLAAVSVAGVLAVADIGDDEQLRVLALQCTNSPLHDAVVVVGA